MKRLGIILITTILMACRPATVTPADSAAIGLALANTITPTHDTVPMLITTNAAPAVGTIGRAFTDRLNQVAASTFQGEAGCAPRRFDAALDTATLLDPSTVRLVVRLRWEDRRRSTGEGLRREYTVVRDTTWRVVDHKDLLQADLIVATRPHECAP